MKIDRQKTAIIRKKISKPVLTCIEDGLLSVSETFLDYGCGRGEDLIFLKKLGYKVSGFDPYYKASLPVKSSIVNLGYVLNVIEDPSERWDTFQKAYDLAENLLIASVMIRDTEVFEKETSYSDGIITSWNTFQKYYTQKEFIEYCQRITIHSLSAGLGIVYLFKNPEWKSNFLSGKKETRIREKLGEIQEEEHNRILNDFILTYHELGRIPLKNEFIELKYIQKYFGSPEKALEKLHSRIDFETVRENSKNQKEKYLVEVCRKIIRRNGLPKWKDLSKEEQMDSKIFFHSFEDSCNRAMDELKSLSELSEISKLINESKVGKVLPDDIYIHKDSIAFAPQKLQIYLELSLMILPKDFEYNLVKIARNSWHITFLNYPEFNSLPHPNLHSSMKVFLHKNQLGYREYFKSENPPILHRKETFLHFSHSQYEKFSSLSQSEEEAGLLSRQDIGYRKQWEKLLQDEGYIIEDHNLRKR
ncbi:MAG: DNA phosphorothioation-associated putative methyltransferase [Leptospiraceae bacterium]|nr:DNA phosphorothioation-associated putative methyltransferase [Leptospiraceae bacterium]MCP5513497.1 DNA phosphorothioation-associated putative methyltransferase [Leptospiraceae bacterium]